MRRPIHFEKSFGSRLLIVCISICVLSRLTIARADSIYNDDCLASFESFAYYGPRDRDEPRTPPLSPWRAVADIPAAALNDQISTPPSGIAPGRIVNGVQEILVSWNNKFAYQPDTHEWLPLSTRVGESGLRAGQTFVVMAGELWAVNYIEQDSTIRDGELAPLFSRLSADTDHFTPIAQGFTVPAIMLRDLRSFPGVILDDQGVFWIFLRGDGVYRYDPRTNMSERRATLSDGRINVIDLEPGGSIYFLVSAEPRSHSSSVTTPTATLSRTPVSRFDPETNEITLLDNPPDSWVGTGSWLVDRAGRLWLGAIGYRSTEGEWHLVHPNLDFLHAIVVRQLGSTPSILFESSDGRLWFNMWADSTYSAEGTAWYDPETGEGCLFTNLVSNITEDAQGHLWLVSADGMLYSYDSQ